MFGVSVNLSTVQAVDGYDKMFPVHRVVPVGQRAVVMHYSPRLRDQRMAAHWKSHIERSVSCHARDHTREK